ncbi:hypothetical protein N9Y37_10870 [Luminiphilus sp.]|nr:hypothetical protein [Luminiphilus sp.]
MRLSPSFEELHAVANLVSDQTFSFSMEYVPNEFDPIEIRLKEGIDIESFDEIDWSGEVASYKGHQVLFYIADQGWDIDEVIENPERGKKYHMSWCTTLNEMKKKGRIERYVATSDLSGRFKVFGNSEEEGSERHARAGLKVCRNCLSNINYKGYKRNKVKVFQDFNIPEFFEHYSSHFEHKPNLEIDPTKGYTDDWDDISIKLRERASWKCQDCSVDLSKDRALLHAHHINGVKSDNRSENLQAVCVECHSKKPDHRHMILTLHNRQRLAQLRQRR